MGAVLEPKAAASVVELAQNDAWALVGYERAQHDVWRAKGWGLLDEAPLTGTALGIMATKACAINIRCETGRLELDRSERTARIYKHLRLVEPQTRPGCGSTSPGLDWSLARSACGRTIAP
jgi:hypothetical protein